MCIRDSQYPHAMSSSTELAAPSIPGRTLTIPLHFWFCETIGNALPLIALQHSEVNIVVDLKNMHQLFTTRDVRESSSTFGERIAPPVTIDQFHMSHFLSPPTYADPTIPVNPELRSWNMHPFIEANFIFVTDAELAHIASTDHSYMITQIDIREAHGQHGASNDLDLIMRNLCTRVVWVSQRNDRALQNDYDNYTNWKNPDEPPLKNAALFMTPWYSSGTEQQTGINSKDILVESTLVIDGKDRFSTKQNEFFKHIQNYRHHSGTTVTELPGIYTYSFALEHDKGQPSGHINGSQFNKTILRNTYVEPPLGSYLGVTAPSNEVCVLKSSLASPNPQVVNPADYSSHEVVHIIRKTEANTLAYTFHTRAFVESYNFLRVIGGIANVVFSS